MGGVCHEKRLIFLALAAILLGFSCEITNLEDSYYFDSGLISQPDYNTVMSLIPEKPSYTYGEIVAAKELFKGKTQIESRTISEANESRVFSALRDMGLSISEIDENIDAADRAGNVLFWKKESEETNQWSWGYIEKL